MGRYYCDAVVHNGTVYCRCDTNDKVYAHHILSSNWSLTPDAPYEGFALAVIDGLLTTIGGYEADDLKNINKLFSLTGEGSGRSWTERVKDNRGKEGEYEQLRHIIDQKDATIIEKE